jgi:Rrf2 family iron-sulfur cluster assembly transcriptional regulator
VRASQQLKYAIYGVFDLAYHGANRPIRVQEIGDRHSIPPRYLEQIFQKLRRAGLVASKRGPGGGYQLRRPAHQITLADVIVAVQGELITRPDQDGDSSESPEFVWELIHEGMRQALGSQTIADLCREAAKRGIARADAEPAMYQI